MKAMGTMKTMKKRAVATKQNKLPAVKEYNKKDRNKKNKSNRSYKHCMTRRPGTRWMKAMKTVKLKLDDCNVAMEMYKKTRKTHAKGPEAKRDCAEKRNRILIT